MKPVTFYQCEHCGKIYAEKTQAIICEAGHCHLSITEYDQWQRLSYIAAQAGRQVGIRKNPETDEAFDKACAALAQFETAHGLTSIRKPSDFYY